LGLKTAGRLYSGSKSQSQVSFRAQQNISLTRLSHATDFTRRQSLKPRYEVANLVKRPGFRLLAVKILFFFIDKQYFILQSNMAMKAFKKPGNSENSRTEHAGMHGYLHDQERERKGA